MRQFVDISNPSMRNINPYKENKLYGNKRLQKFSCSITELQVFLLGWIQTNDLVFEIEVTAIYTTYKFLRI